MSILQPKIISSTMSESVTMPRTLARIQEKEQLKLVIDRFSAYIQRIRLLGEHGTIDSSVGLRNQKILEEEITNVKSIYEKELHAMRKQINGVKLEKSSYQVKFINQQQQFQELRDRLAVEISNNQRILDEFNGVRRKALLLEQELNEKRMEANKPSAQLQQLLTDFKTMSSKYQSLKQRYDSEQVFLQRARDNLQQLQAKQKLTEEINTKQIDDLKNRLQISVTTILKLEAKSRELMVLQTQMNRDTENVTLAMREKQKLHKEYTDLQVKIRHLESKIASLEQEKVSLEGVIIEERQQPTDQFQILEGKVREFQALMVSTIQEAHTTRDAYVPMRAEIEALRILLEDEENRLNFRLDTFPKIVNNSSLSSVAFASAPVYDSVTHLGNISSSRAIGSNAVTSYRASNHDGTHTSNAVTLYHETTNALPPVIGNGMYSATSLSGLPLTSLAEVPYELDTMVPMGLNRFTESKKEMKKSVFGDANILELHHVGNYTRATNDARASRQKNGNGRLKIYRSSTHETVRGSGGIANRSAGTIQWGQGAHA